LIRGTKLFLLKIFYRVLDWCRWKHSPLLLQKTRLLAGDFSAICSFQNFWKCRKPGTIPPVLLLVKIRVI